MTEIGETTAPLKEMVRQDIPEGHSEESGYCFRDALEMAGYDVELPSWVHVDDVPIICEELGLEYLIGQGKTFTLPREQPLIIGHTVQQGKNQGEKRMGHWTYTEKPENTLREIESKDIFALIPIQ